MVTRATEDGEGLGVHLGPPSQQVGLLGDPKCVCGDVCVPSVVSPVCVVWVPAWVCLCVMPLVCACVSGVCVCVVCLLHVASVG